MGEGVMVAGIGCRAGVSGEQVEAAIDAAIAALCARLTEATMPAAPAIASAQSMAGANEGSEPTPRLVTEVASPQRGSERGSALAVGRNAVTAIATAAAKANEPGIRAAAAAWGVPLLEISQPALESANSATVTRSTHSMAAMNVHSVAEAAALAGATMAAATMATATTKSPRLLQPRIVLGPVTCALADTTTP